MLLPDCKYFCIKYEWQKNGILLHSSKHLPTIYINFSLKFLPDNEYSYVYEAVKKKKKDRRLVKHKNTQII